jgi:hypothetical protein
MWKKVALTEATSDHNNNVYHQELESLKNINAGSYGVGVYKYYDTKAVHVLFRYVHSRKLEYGYGYAPHLFLW